VNFEAFIVSAPSQPGENHGKTLPKNDPVCGDQINFADPDFDGELIQMTFGLRGRTPPGSLEAPLSDHALLI
jgi:hypothetical protein